MREEIVRRRGWLDDAEFLDYVGATNLIPGPNSTELAIHLGHRRAGARGLVAAGTCFIVPAVLIVATLAWLYENHGTDPAVVDLRYGILPVIIAIIGHAVYGLGRTAVNNAINAVLAGGAFAAYLVGVHELLILVAAGVIAAVWAQRRRLAFGGNALALLLLPIGVVDQGAPRASSSLPRLFLVFLEIGSVLYGSGYVLLAFLQRSLVDHYGWLSTQELLDAVAVGQITPGPVFSTATFVGWQIDGPAGAAVATLGIFLPSFVFVALLGRIVPWMQARPAARVFLNGVTAASLGLMAGVAVELTGSAIVDVVTGTVAVLALAALITSKVSPTWLIAAGVAIGIVHAIA
jgi:chromate transporter